ncbi:hypothetical protein AcW2_005102 [Taiwanofungus camphoratus]|nr:hypothetical protein AcW2_005102 [Antrodia cinnamomea]
MISVWGPIMSAYAHGTQPKQVALQAIMYIVSSTFQHNAACIWNDICDRDIDCRVERTKNRPIASGKISVPKAVLFMILNCIIYLATLFCGGTTVLQITILGLLTLDAIYPLTKQFSNWPQAFLGLCPSVLMLTDAQPHLDCRLGYCLGSIYCTGSEQ